MTWQREKGAHGQPHGTSYMDMDMSVRSMSTTSVAFPVNFTVRLGPRKGTRVTGVGVVDRRTCLKLVA